MTQSNNVLPHKVSDATIVGSSRFGLPEPSPKPAPELKITFQFEVILWGDNEIIQKKIVKIKRTSLKLAYEYMIRKYPAYYFKLNTPKQ